MASLAGDQAQITAALEFLFQGYWLDNKKLILTGAGKRLVCTLASAIAALGSRAVAVDLDADAASYVTGQHLSANGGYTIGL